MSAKFKLDRATQRQSGMTLVEIMVSVAIGSLMLALMAVVFASSNRSFVSMGNYVSMDAASRNALDQMSRDIRRSKNILGFSTNQLVFNYAGTTNLVYKYDPASRTLTSWKNGDSKTNNLLTECDQLQFSMYRNIPLSGGTFAPTTDPSQGKCISVAWHCSRTVLGQKLNSEDMQQALIVVRNKPLP